MREGRALHRARGTQLRSESFYQNPSIRQDALKEIAETYGYNC